MAAKVSRPALGLMAIILAIIAGLWTVDSFLARTETRETQAEARRYHDRGVSLLKANQAAAAIEPLRKAYTLDRDNVDYEIDLSAALLEAGKTAEARQMLDDVLGKSPNDGEANLLEARLMLRTGNFAQAEAYYHRAIYGIWPDNSAAHRVAVRLELAGALAKRGASQELLAELLAFGPEATENPDVEKKIAGWFLDAGAPQRAAELYRSLMNQDPGDPSNAAGYGEAELTLGNYRAAEIAFRKAGDDKRAALAGQIAGIDPTVRTLSSAEKFRRSTAILQMTRDMLARCKGDPKLVDEADALLAKKERGPATNELSEERLSLAQDLWDAKPPECQPDDVLRLLMQKLEQ